MKRMLSMLLFFAGGLNLPAQCVNPQNYSSPSQVTSAGAVQLVAAPGNATGEFPRAQSIHICRVTIQVVQGSSPANFGLIAGTGTNCATVSMLASPAWIGVASSPQSWAQSYGDSLLTLPPSTALCLNLSAAPTGAVVYVQYSIY